MLALPRKRIFLLSTLLTMLVNTQRRQPPPTPQVKGTWPGLLAYWTPGTRPAAQSSHNTDHTLYFHICLCGLINARLPFQEAHEFLGLVLLNHHIPLGT